MSSGTAPGRPCARSCLVRLAWSWIWAAGKAGLAGSCWQREGGCSASSGQPPSRRRPSPGRPRCRSRKPTPPSCRWLTAALTWRWRRCPCWIWMTLRARSRRPPASCAQAGCSASRSCIRSSPPARAAPRALSIHGVTALPGISALRRSFRAGRPRHHHCQHAPAAQRVHRGAVPRGPSDHRPARARRTRDSVAARCPRGETLMSPAKPSAAARMPTASRELPAG